MNLTWDLKFLFLVEVGDSFLGRLPCTSPHAIVASSAASHAPSRGERAAACLPSRRRRVYCAPAIVQEDWRLAPGHAPISCRIALLVAPREGYLVRLSSIGPRAVEGAAMASSRKLMSGLWILLGLEDDRGGEGPLDGASPEACPDNSRFVS
ncbi:hypothetical protein HAX54_000150 [Datura stramonium]|uniref:Uncharacterized protein n=1 Tax=Datura stramonium TaxID=4076 RepID=A0ABS8WS54_DATST|nr:hypothetical protein [Datura stramonium]